MKTPITMLAPAKVNLFLHVLGRRDNGYHNLQSLIMFADFGDHVTLKPSDTLGLTLHGDYAGALNTSEKDTSENSSNILIKALWAIAKRAGQTPAFDITLTKNIPLGAGLGGGSADAAALIRALCDLWNIDSQSDTFKQSLFALGADVPACFTNAPCHIKGTGEDVFKAPDLFDIPALLIHPNKKCSTKDVFNKPFKFSDAIDIPTKFESREALMAFLKTTRNDLYAPASTLIPDIQEVLNAIKAQDNILYASMSGSGSACFGLFDTVQSAQHAAQIIKNLHPEWWVQAVTLKS